MFCFEIAFWRQILNFSQPFPFYDNQLNCFIAAYLFRLAYGIEAGSVYLSDEEEKIQQFYDLITWSLPVDMNPRCRIVISQPKSHMLPAAVSSSSLLNHHFKMHLIASIIALSKYRSPGCSHHVPWSRRILQSESVSLTNLSFYWQTFFFPKLLSENRQIIP